MSRAATRKGTPRRRRMELAELDRIARREAPAAYANLPARIRLRRLERLRRDLASGRVQLPSETR